MKFKSRMVGGWRTLGTLAAMGLALGTAGLAQAQNATSGSRATWSLIDNGTPAPGRPWSLGVWSRELGAMSRSAPGMWNRFELTASGPNSPQGLGDSVTGLGASSVLGLQMHVAGDGAAGSDAWTPKITMGLQQKSFYPAPYSTPAGPMLHPPGSRTTATDLYLSASKLFPAQGLLLNATLRASRNPYGLAVQGGYSLRPELSVAFLLSNNISMGAEYRFRAANVDPLARGPLGESLRDDDGRDLYIAWAPYKNLSLTLAYVGEGRSMPGLTVTRRPSRSYFAAEYSF
jgi:hypothetical protein